MASPAKTLRHVVLFGFGPDASGNEINAIVARFTALERLVPGVEAFEWGRDVSPRRAQSRP